MDPNEELEYASRAAGSKGRARPTVATQGSMVNLEGDTPVERLARDMGEEPVREVGRIATHRAQGRRERSKKDEPGTGPARGADTPGRLSDDVAQQTLFSRREHSKGDGNLPAAEPHPGIVDERPRDRVARDVPKERDDRSAPKGNATRGQADRDPSLDRRDDYKGERPEGAGPVSRASATSARAARPRRPAAGTRPKARRSSAAKRNVTTRTDPRAGRAKTNIRQAPKSASRSGRRAAIARRPQVGGRRTGTAPRGDAVPRAARGNVGARRAAKASRASAKDRRERATRGS